MLVVDARLGFAIGLAVCAAGCVFDPSGTGIQVIDGSPDVDRDGGADAARPGGPDAAPSATTLAVGDVRLLYAHKSTRALRSVRWRADTAMWQREDSTPELGEVHWVVAEVAGDQELAAVVVEDSGAFELALVRAIDGGWTIDVTDDGYEAPRSARGVDLAIEDASGDAMVVYAADRATPAYRTRVAGAWSQPMTAPWADVNTGRVVWVELEARPGTDELALAYADDTGALVVALWDGDAWRVDRVAQLEAAVTVDPRDGALVNRPFDLAYEREGDQLVVAWGASGGAGYRWTTTTATGWAPAQNVAVVNGEVRHLELAADPTSERVALAAYDLGGGTERLGVAMWTGAAWDDVTEIDSQTNDINDDAAGDLPGAVAWLPAGGDAVCVYADDQDGTLDFAAWDEVIGYVMAADVAMTGKRRTESARAVTAAGGDVFVALSDSTGALFAARFDGLFWTFAANGGDPLDTATSTESVPFDLAARLR